MKEEQTPEELANKIMDLIGRAVVSRAKELVPKWHGDLMRSISYQVVDDGVIIQVAQPYGEDMEFGRLPGPIDDPENLQEWASEHNIPYKFVKSKIEKKGIKVGTVKNPMETFSGYRPFLRPAIFQVSQPEKLAEVLSSI